MDSTFITKTDNDNNTTNEIKNNEQTITQEETIEKEFHECKRLKEIRLGFNVGTKAPEVEVSKTTTDTEQLTKTVPVITDNEGTDYQLHEIAIMNLEQLNDLASRTTVLRVETKWNGINVYYNGDLIVQQRKHCETITLTPDIIQMRSTLRRPTTSSWSIESNGATWTARQIEQLSSVERHQLDVVRNNDIGFWMGGNEESIRIDYQVPISQDVRAGFIEMSHLNEQARFGVDGLAFEVNDNDDISKVSIDKNCIRLNRNAVIPTVDEWIFPGTNISTRDFEVMNEQERANAIAEMQQHVINETGEEWVDIIYRDEIVASIDRRIHQDLILEDGMITIRSLAKFTITQ